VGALPYQRTLSQPFLEAFTRHQTAFIEQTADRDKVGGSDNILVLIRPEQHPTAGFGMLKPGIGAGDGAILETQFKENPSKRGEARPVHDKPPF
jgi:hypothetical protein